MALIKIGSKRKYPTLLYSIKFKMNKIKLHLSLYLSTSKFD
jgi:hypothetical protein